MIVRRTVRPPALLALAFALAAGSCAPSRTDPPLATVTGPAASSPPPAATAGVTPESSTTVAPSPAPEATAAPAIIPGVVDRSSLEVTASYDVGLEVTVGTGTIAVETAIEARNDSGGSIDRLELNTIAARLGGLEVTEATVDGRPVSVSIDDQTLVVPLGGTLADGAAATVRIGYRATLRPRPDGSDWLFSRIGGTLALYRWIPWVSRAVPFDRPNHGDPFVTPSSPLVRVRVTTDVPMVLASPGADPVADGSAWSFEVRDVRDVAILLAPDFEVTTGDAGGIQIRAYTRPGGLDGDRLVAQAANALTRMADLVGVPYPWPAYSVVETAGGYGMEAPGLVFIPRDVAPVNLRYLVHHETAHQWFYGLVGNNQQAEPFADEAAADLLARTVLGTRRGSRCDRAPLDLAITEYSAACYYEVVYIQGGNVLDDIRAGMGSERFWATVRDYLNAHRFALAGTRPLLEALRAASPVDLEPTLRARFPSLY